MGKTEGGGASRLAQQSKAECVVSMVKQAFPPPPSAEEAKANPVALLELREHYSREKLVKIEEQKLVREELKQRYRREGVNHISKCKDLANEYIKLVKENQAAISLN